MRIKRISWLLLLMLVCGMGCSTPPRPTPGGQLPPASIPTPQDAPAEPTYKPDVPPRYP